MAPAGSNTIDGTVTVVGSWSSGASASVGVKVAASTAVAEVVLHATAEEDIALWWPAGLGTSTLYSLTVKFCPSAAGASPCLTTQRRIGFRAAYLVTGNDTDPSSLKGVDGSGDFTMRVPGCAVLYARASVFGRGGG